ncbi:MAG TPA: GAF domain-containing protein [Candidatus Limnocylindria bacterium]
MGGAADLERELAESRAREDALAAVLGIMRRAPGELVGVLDAVLDRAASLCGAERASIHLIDGDVYRTAAFWGPPNPEYERVAYDTPRKPGRETLIGRTAFEREIVHIPDALADPEYTATDLQRLGGYRTMLGVPLFRGDGVAGVFVLTRNDVRPFSEQEIALVRAFADQAVVAVENARLIKSTSDALERQTAVSQVLSDMSRSVFDLERVLESVAMNAVRLCAADNGSIARLGSDGWRIVANAGDIDPDFLERNWDNEPIEANRRSLTGRVLVDKGTTAIVDALADPDYDIGNGLFKFRSLVGVPLTRGPEIVGVLILRRGEPKPFTPEQIHLLETFADQASIAIENVRLFNETKEALERQTATSEILRVIAASPTEVQPVLDAIAESAARVCGASDAHVYRVDGQVLKQWAHFGPIPGLAPDESLPLSRGSIIGRSILDRQAIHIKDAVDLDPAEYPISSQLQRRWEYRTTLSVPLMRHGVGIGGIAIRRTHVQPFTSTQIELLETFADQAAIAIANVELFQTVERQRAELSRFLSPQVAALITSEQGAKMLEGHRRQITVAFCDLRGFTAFAETAEPEEVLGVLRDYHRAMGEIIVEHQGTLEHFAGDGMMVFFNDPLPVEHHELQALRMSVAMRTRFDEMARSWLKRGYELGFGVGIATGYATLGRIGFEGRYDYGAIGNVVILAQRLSAEAKAGQILLSQRVHAAVETDAETTAVGDLTLKGFTRPVPAFAAVSAKTPAPARS